LPRIYTHTPLESHILGELVNIISRIQFDHDIDKEKDILGRVYEYFLSQFASAEGKKGGQFYTPRCVVQTLVAMLTPYKGRVYDPCCGSGGMFVQSEKFVEAHGGTIDVESIPGRTQFIVRIPYQTTETEHYIQT
jgi:type I restriction enzyme M protein